jgi:hypothetical protein
MTRPYGGRIPHGDRSSPCKAVYNVRKSMATPHATKLNTRQLKFIQGKLTGKSNARAAREAGYAESVARAGEAGRAHGQCRPVG